MMRQPLLTESTAVKREKTMKKKREVQISVIRSRRKTIALQIREDGSVLVRAPYWMTNAEISSFVKDKKDWIRRHLDKLGENVNNSPGTFLSEAELRSLAERAAEAIPSRVAFFARKLGVTYGRITIRCQRTRWGSCSEKGNLNFNCLLMKAPKDVLDYVVVHELCHRLEMNHSSRFWAEVAKVLPDYKASEKWLRENGKLLIRQVHG